MRVQALFLGGRVKSAAASTRSPDRFQLIITSFPDKLEALEIHSGEESES